MTTRFVVRLTSKALLLAVFLPAVLVSPAAAVESCRKKDKTVCTNAGDGGFGLGQTGDGSHTDGSSNEGAHRKSGEAERTTITEKAHVPTCTGNDPGENTSVCTAATETCPEEGQVRYWVYTREVTVATGATTPWVRVADPSSVCLGADDPALDPAAAIPALIERDFKRVVVLKGVADVSPQPDTLVNIPTVFTTDAPDSYDIPLTLLGQSVVITAKAERWTWHFGDGSSAWTTTPGSKGRVEHEYTQAGTREAYVVIEWSGTYRIGGGPTRPISGRATTTGDPARVQVREARTELVRD
jgi:hypothetical protein